MTLFTDLLETLTANGPLPLIALGLLLLFVLLVIRAFVRRGPRLPWTFRAKVLWVADGDTIRVKEVRRLGILSRTVKIRLLGIDAPETEQPWGRESGRALRDLIGGETVAVRAVAVDRYGRYVAEVTKEEKGSSIDVSLRMIETGAAWPYYSYLKFLPRAKAAAYRRAGEAAKAARLGLWAAKDTEPPWDWRERHRPLLTRFLRWIARLFRRLLGLGR